MRRPHQLRNIRAGLIIALLFISVFIVYGIVNMRTVMREKRVVDASLQSLRVLQALMDDVQDMETGHRGYLISGKKEHLESYTKAVRDLPSDTQTLKALAAFYPERVPVFSQLLQLVVRKKELSEQNIRLMERGASDSARMLVQSGSGKQVMDSIRSIITRLDASDHQLLNQANQRRARAAKATALLFVLLALLFLTGVIIFFFRLSRNNRAREQYERQIAYLAGLTEKTSDAIFSTDTGQHIRSWNKAATEMYGFSSAEAMGKKAPDLLHLRQEESEAEQQLRQLQHTGHATGEYGVVRKSGELLFVQASVSALTDEKGEPAGFVHIHRDITERKKAEHFLQTFNEELAQQVEEKTALVNNIVRRLRDGFYSLDENFCFNYVNESVKGFTGYNSEQMIGKHILEIFPEVEGLGIYKKLQRAFRDQVNESEELYYAPLGKWFNVHIYPSENGLTVFSRDVTAIRKAEEKLRASNERFEMITRTTNDAVWEWNLETGELWGNETHQHLYGLQPDDPVPPETEWLSRIHPDDRPGMIHKQERALSSDANVFITEYRFNTVERGYRNIYDRCYIVRNDEGKATRILGSMMDITDRKQAELALMQSEEKYRSMIEQASDGIFIMDGQGRYIDTNTAACTMVGYSREEMRGMSAIDILPAGGIPVPQLKRKELQEGQTVILERTLRRKNGDLIDTEVSYKQLSNGNFLAIARDITEKKKAEDEIRRSNARFQMLSKATSDIVWDWDLQEDMIWWNDNYYLLLGLTRNSEKEPIGEWYARIHPDDLARVKQDVEKGISNRSSYYSHEYRFARADGSYLHFLDRTFILWGPDGQPLRMIGSMVNMTPIYEAQRVVAESENRLRTIISSEPQCIKLLDSEGVLLDMNPAGLAMVEADSLEQVKGMSVHQLVDEQYRPDFMRLTKEVFGGRSGSLLFSLTGMKGSHRWLETHAVPMKDAAGHIIALLGVTTDVTDKHKAEEELKRNEEKYRTLVEQAVDAIALYDANGRVLDVNTGSVNLLGYSKEELLGMSLSDILTGEEIQVRPVQYEVLQRGESTVKQRQMRRKDGSIVETEVRSQQLPDGRFLSVIRDLTERIKAQQQIEKEKILSDKLIDSLPGVFYWYDETGKFLRWNKQFELVTGYSAAEIRGMQPADFFLEKDRKLMGRKIREVFTRGSADAEAGFLHKNGNSTPYYFKAIRMTENGKPSLLGYGIDISDRKKAEFELEQSYRAIRKLTSHLQNIREQERGHIAREIHDELGQQLTVLKMDISWLNKKLGKSDDIIRDKMKDLLAMLDETVRSVRRISSELRPSLLDDLGLVAAMEWQLQEFEKRSGIHTRFEGGGEELSLPESIKTALFRIFQESLTNVARHSQANTVSVHFSQQNGNLVLSIEDDGKGFDRQQVAEKRTLGILGMKERTSMMDGTYDIVSKPGNGTIVTVKIPLNQPKPSVA